MDNLEVALVFSQLKAGYGFSLSCINANVDIRVCSVKLQTDSNLLKKFNSAIKVGLTTLLDHREQHLKNKNYDELKKVDDLLNTFVARIVLWGDAKVQLTPQSIVSSKKIYANTYELATAFKLSINQLLIYADKHKINI